MHTIKLQVQDSIYSHIMFLLNNLNTKELKIIEDRAISCSAMENNSDMNAFTNHAASLVDEWKDAEEDEIWK